MSVGMMQRQPLVSEPLEEGLFGKRLGQHFGVESTPLYAVRKNGRLTLALTRLTSALEAPEQLVPIPPEPAFSIFHELRDRAPRRDTHGDRADALSSGAVSVVDLSESPHCDLGGLVDTLQYYLPKTTLDEFAHEHGASPVSTLLCRKEDRDPVVATLSKVLLSAIEEGIASNQLLIDHLALSLVAHFAQAYGGLRIDSRSEKGGLAAWQVRRATEIMRTRLGSNLSIREVASECRLTPSHFARMFRKSTGIAPHEYLSNLRIEEAKRLMLDTALPLADIALIAGFNDQSHFTRAFSRRLQVSPGAWRRLHVSPC